MHGQYVVGSGAIAGAVTERQQTFNERLNRVAEGLVIQCDRIQQVLAGVNGTPQAKESVLQNVAQIRPSLPLAQAVEHLEQVQQRLAELASGVERIA